MDLWIRSQDKELIQKVNIGIMYLKDATYRNCIANRDNETGFSILGAYETKEKALEVLDEIQELIKPKIITTSYECECKDNLKDKMKFSLEMNPIKTEIQELSTYVYQMPKE